MASDEQRVRTMAGWIGVEISRSRVRTPGKPGYGLYRVRGSELPKYPTSIGQDPTVPVVTEWTAYAFGLQEIQMHVGLAIAAGTPARPGRIDLPDRSNRGVVWMVPTRWTQAYRGSRTLGGGGADAAVGDAVLRETDRSRQRATNDEFQKAHLERRRYGKAQRHAARLRNDVRRTDPSGG